MESDEAHKLQLKTVDQVGVVVKDIDKVIESWSAMFGISRWTCIDNSGTDAKGQPVKLRLAFTRLGPVQLELIQPVEGRIFHSDFLDTHGEGLHHLGFYVDDLEGEVKNLIAQGTKILSARQGIYAYLDSSEPGGVIFELIKRRKR